jgi:hypothetical protein
MEGIPLFDSKEIPNITKEHVEILMEKIRETFELRKKYVEEINESSSKLITVLANFCKKTDGLQEMVDLLVKNHKEIVSRNMAYIAHLDISISFGTRAFGALLPDILEFIKKKNESNAKEEKEKKNSKENIA